MARRCSRCGEKGHNSRTCTHVKPFSFKLFGVKLTCQNQLEKSFSPATFMDYHGPPLVYQCVRKKGVPWSEEEHWFFLLGLQKLGRGDWRGISREFVRTRTPTQVASHAQKYFLSRTNFNKRKRKMSLFDMPTEETSSLPIDENTITNSVKQKIGSEFGKEGSGETTSQSWAGEESLLNINRNKYWEFQN
ncbi:hypothetical protein SUGI_0919500 [Cryptomeria japonica]|uniref:transcription factor KUA1 n=1 Tax=Cryptomeria japonica TaxID=3369 RepID=UPI0024147690|nr:transcription factor KUA1 [Cryptomeria japonica]GLJ44091.1 hypothetical protein SUGI_0919500 [Cryptomeria japonica]